MKIRIIVKIIIIISYGILELVRLCRLSLVKIGRRINVKISNQELLLAKPNAK